MNLKVKCPKCDYEFTIELVKAQKEIAALRKEIMDLRRGAGSELFDNIFGGKK